MQKCKFIEISRIIKRVEKKNRNLHFNLYFECVNILEYSNSEITFETFTKAVVVKNALPFACEHHDCNILELNVDLTQKLFDGQEGNRYANVFYSISIDKLL